MASEADLARLYDGKYPGVDIPDAQKAERAERLLHREELRSARRSNRTRGIVVPDLPWLKHTKDL